ncbi:MAG: hypothetical protein PF961_11980 [Planctomycetota bacterium]|jgi:hypothetical protein|nr:hypothetical protein [Planctomycetota bacterium]
MKYIILLLLVTSAMAADIEETINEAIRLDYLQIPIIPSSDYSPQLNEAIAQSLCHNDFITLLLNSQDTKLRATFALSMLLQEKLRYSAQFNGGENAAQEIEKDARDRLQKLDLDIAQIHERLNEQD